MKKGYAGYLIVAAVVASLFAPVAATAQSNWLNPQHHPAIYLEINRPQFQESSEETSVWSLFLSGEFKVARNANIIIEIPWVRYSYSYNYGPEFSFTETSSTTGNPYIGLVSTTLGSGSLWEAGVRLPITDEDDFASLIGAVTHWPRLEAYAPNIVAVRVRGGYRYISPSGVMLLFKVGPLFTIPTENDKGIETEAYADFDFELWAPVDQFWLGACLNNRYILTEDADGTSLYSDNFFSELVLSGNATFGQIRPGVHFSLPVDDLVADFVDYTIGVNLLFYLSKEREGI